MNGPSRYQFKFYRVLVGLLLVFFWLVTARVLLNQFPLAADDVRIISRYARPFVVPNLFFYHVSQTVVLWVVLSGIFFSLLIGLGYWSRMSALCVGYLIYCVWSQSFLRSTGTEFYLLLTVLFYLAVAGYEQRPVVVGITNPVVLPFQRLAWFLIGLVYLSSGITHLVQVGVIRFGPNLATLHMFLPQTIVDLKRLAVILHPAIWVVMAVETFALLFFVSRDGRKLFWFLLLGLHLSTLVIGVANPVISLTLIAFLVFLFEPGWFPPLQPKGLNVVFFDGTCSFCSRLIRFLFVADRGSTLLFSPLQGATARKMLSDDDVPAAAVDPSTIVFLYEAGTTSQQIFTKSSAVLKIAEIMGGGWKMLAPLRIVPRPLRDAVYVTVVRYRKQLQSTVAECSRVPSELPERFLS